MSDTSYTAGGNYTRLGSSISFGLYKANEPGVIDGQNAALRLDDQRRLVIRPVGIKFVASDGWGNDSMSAVDSNNGGSIPVFGGYYLNDTTGKWDRVKGSPNGTYVIIKGSTNFATGQVAVGTGATPLIGARAGRQRVTFSASANLGFYIGTDATVTTATGFYVPAGGTFSMETTGAIYAVGAMAVTVTYVETF